MKFFVAKLVKTEDLTFVRSVIGKSFQHLIIELADFGRCTHVKENIYLIKSIKNYAYIYEVNETVLTEEQIKEFNELIK